MQVVITEDTAVQMFTQVEPDELENGTRVTVVGQRGEDGAVMAQTIVIVPEGSGELFGGQGFRGRQGDGLSIPGR